MRTHSLLLLALVCFGAASPQLLATDLIQITAENFDEVVPRGKETDAIYGDWVLRNKHITAVIAAPTPGRKANMTVRGVAGMLIDLTTRYNGSDQLSCFYPTGGRYLFEGAENLTLETESGARQILNEKSELHELSSEAITLSVIGSPLSADDTTATVKYSLTDDQPFLAYSVELRNEGSIARELRIEDSLRCDGDLFQTGNLEDDFFANDEYFGQCYLFSIDGHAVRKSGGRNMQLRTDKDEVLSLKQGETLSWSGKVFCSQGITGVRTLRDAVDLETTCEDVILLLKSNGPRGPVAHARVEYFHDQQSLGVSFTDNQGFLRTKLRAGNYVAKIKALGHEEFEHEIVVEEGRPRADNLSLEPASRVRAKIVDGMGQAIAAKVQFIGLEETESPNFGPTSAIYAVRNVVYSAQGTFEQPIDPGKYLTVISHGPEYDAVFQEILVEPGQLVPLSVSLERVVDTTSWISAEFHSHSSPSGDNVSHQTGRVLNLLAEHLEFAPCTEHNRIDTYTDDLLELNATQAMATCSGMELTGGPLPINHQNAFPLHMHEHHQDGGGPQTDSDPVKQIERLALWDDSSAKVVQSNHPNIPSILGDRDLNGKPDEGFRGMLGWMDVIEVHPPQNIFEVPAADVAPNDRGNRMFYWMQLLNLGYRIPGVVNTDAHYNFHGSGGLRNYMESTTDQPSEISVDEMIHVAEHGHIVMTTGPFLQAEIRRRLGANWLRFAVGEDVEYQKGDTLWIRVQCPNWFDVNRVQVFANGKPLPKFNFTRKETPEFFFDTVVRFELQVALPKLEEDTHLIVATIGEGIELGSVMGPEWGKQPPVAVTNPFFLDVDGGGFQGNGDDLGVPYMVEVDK